MISKLPQTKQANKKKVNAELTKNKENQSQSIERQGILKSDNTLTVNEMLKLLNPETIFGAEYKPQNLVVYKEILTDMNQPLPKKDICRNWQQGNCQLSDQCKYIHQASNVTILEKTECFTFSNYGFCLNGEKCSMKHSLNIPSMQYQLQLNNTHSFGQSSLQQENRLLVFLKLEEKIGLIC